MQYMESGGFRNHRFMRLTLLWTTLFLAAFWITNFAMYFDRMGLTPSSVQAYYLGSEVNFTSPKTFGAMLEVSHSHLPIQAVVILLLTHLLLFAPFKGETKLLFIYAAFASSLTNEGSGWLIRFVHPNFAVLKIIAFLTLQTTLAFLLISLGMFLYPGAGRMKRSASSGHKQKR